MQGVHAPSWLAQEQQEGQRGGWQQAGAAVGSSSSDRGSSRSSGKGSCEALQGSSTQGWGDDVAASQGVWAAQRVMIWLPRGSVSATRVMMG